MRSPCESAPFRGATGRRGCYTRLSMQTTRTPPQRRPSDTGTTPPAPATAGQKMYSAAAIVAAAFVASRVLGLVREVIIAARFGTSGEYDAYVAAFKIPDLLFQMVMAGA